MVFLGHLTVCEIGGTVSFMPTLQDPVPIGAWNLRNRIVMAPLTRCRASEGRVPNDLMAEYYRQRSSAGMIISEATSISPMGVGYPDTPGIWSDAQVEGWKLVTSAVHEAGGLILLQLWHVGRISDPIYLEGKLPVAPSAIAAAGHVSLVRPKKAFVTPRALELEEIPGIVAEYRTGRRTQKRRDSTAWSCTARTAICSISFSRIKRTSGRMPMADRSRTGRA